MQYDVCPTSSVLRGCVGGLVGGGGGGGGGATGFLFSNKPPVEFPQVLAIVDIIIRDSYNKCCITIKKKNLWYLNAIQMMLCPRQIH